ncbi:YqfQ family protein [Jeotgalibacillus proteolyticus]|nr:YqfQ family protein [Jeotgalibacillus proteolyticus]
MNRRQSIPYSGFQMPGGHGAGQRMSPFSTRSSYQPQGGFSPFTQGRQQAGAQKKGLLSIFSRKNNVSAGQPGIGNMLSGANQFSQPGGSGFFQQGFSPAAGAGQFMQGGGEQAARGIGSLLGGSQGSGGTGAAASLLSAENLQRWVGSTQQMISTAQQALPMIQQYGPLIRNFPAMWKLYRSLKTEGDDKKDSEEAAEPVVNEQSLLKEPEDEKESVVTEAPVARRERESLPKLFV